MSMIDLTMKHGRTLDEARASLEQSVQGVQSRFGPLIRRANWDPDRSRVRLEGAGFWVEMSVDGQDVHASGDIPALAGFLGGPLGAGIKQIVRTTFAKGLPGGTKP